MKGMLAAKHPLRRTKMKNTKTVPLERLMEGVIPTPDIAGKKCLTSDIQNLPRDSPNSKKTKKMDLPFSILSKKTERNLPLSIFIAKCFLTQSECYTVTSLPLIYLLSDDRLASCPWGPVTVNGVDLLTGIYVISSCQKSGP